MSFFKKLLKVVAIVILVILIVMAVWVLLAMAATFLGMTATATALASSFTTVFSSIGLTLTVVGETALVAGWSWGAVMLVGGAAVFSGVALATAEKKASQPPFPSPNDPLVPVDPEDVDVDPSTDDEPAEGKVRVRRLLVDPSPAAARSHRVEVLGDVTVTDGGPTLLPATAVPGYDIIGSVIAPDLPALELREQATASDIRNQQAVTASGFTATTNPTLVAGEFVTIVYVKRTKAPAPTPRISGAAVVALVGCAAALALSSKKPQESKIAASAAEVR